MIKENRADVQRDLEAAHARGGMSSLERRSLEPLATIYLAGKIMQEIGIIPSGFDVKRVLDWAIDNRVGGVNLLDEVTRSGDALRTAYGQMLHTQILRYDPRKIEDDYRSAKDKKLIENLIDAAEEMTGGTSADGDLPVALGYPPVVGYLYTDRKKEEQVIFYAQGFDKLLNGGNVETFLKSLKATGDLIELNDGERTRMKHKKMPNDLAIPNIRIRLDWFMGEES